MINQSLDIHVSLKARRSRAHQYAMMSHYIEKFNLCAEDNINNKMQTRILVVCTINPQTGEEQGTKRNQKSVRHLIQR
jgi:hypothetical protein